MAADTPEPMENSDVRMLIQPVVMCSTQNADLWL
jgi:hypothetical protein